MADLSKMDDDELEARKQALADKLEAFEAPIREERAEIAAEQQRRADQARYAAIADAMTDEDREALRQHLALPRAEG